MVIFKKSIPRRTFLKGACTAIALPLLDAMVPALGRAAASKAPTRFGVVYVPNGMWPMDKWTPKAEGALELTPTLAPLAPYRDRLLVVSGLAQKEAIALVSEGAQDHARASATYLNGVRMKPTGGKDLRAGTSIDQLAAKELGKDTELTSLEVGLFADVTKGTCDSGWSCVYNNTLCWRTPSTPLPMESNPRALFERLFGDTDSTDRTERLARIQEQRSILDWVVNDAASFAKNIGPGDRAKLNEYLDSVRDIERRIQVAEQQSNSGLEKFDKPAGVPASLEQYAKLMFDLNALAYQADLTRVSTFMMAYEGGTGTRSYPELGISDVHHSLTHHMNEADKIDKCFQINLYHVKLFAHFLEKLQSIPDGDGTVLDHTTLLYGSALSNGNGHDHTNLPTLLVGARDLFKGGRHLRYPQGTPMTNLFLTMLDKFGAHMEKFGDSTGKLDLLSV
jgi:hypothetical protein